MLERDANKKNEGLGCVRGGYIKRGQKQIKKENEC